MLLVHVKVIHETIGLQVRIPNDDLPIQAYEGSDASDATAPPLHVHFGGRPGIDLGLVIVADVHGLDRSAEKLPQVELFPFPIATDLEHDRIVAGPLQLVLEGVE